jgi:hypothetical protein
MHAWPGCRRNIHQVSKDWNNLAASSHVISRQLSLPYVFDARTHWDDIMRWITRRAGRVEVLDLFKFVANDPHIPNPYPYVRPDKVGMVLVDVCVVCMYSVSVCGGKSLHKAERMRLRISS